LFGFPVDPTRLDIAIKKIFFYIVENEQVLLELFARGLYALVPHVHVPHVELLPLTELAEHAELDQAQVELVLLLPAVQHRVLDLLALAEVTHAIVTYGEVLVFAAVHIVHDSDLFLKKKLLFLSL
jgi:hypothetical protein